MAKVKLSADTLKVIKDLQDDLNDMLKLGSNIEVVWKLENLHHDKAFLKSADYIRKSLNKAAKS